MPVTQAPGRGPVRRNREIIIVVGGRLPGVQNRKTRTPNANQGVGPLKGAGPWGEDLIDVPFFVACVRCGSLGGGC